MSIKNRQALIPICNKCDKGMIFTCAFSGKEYWCWSCGYTDEFFCHVDRKELDEEDEAERQAKLEEAKVYLGARGCLYGGGYREIDGKIVPFSKLPEELQKQVREESESWEYVNK